VQEAVRLEPENAVFCNKLAWLLATCPAAPFRDGAQAVKFATKACEKTCWKEPYPIDILAAAYAETGKFDNAIQWEKKAMELAPEQQKAEFRARLELYEKDQPYRLPEHPWEEKAASQ
jgi:hypothetical protein